MAKEKAKAPQVSDQESSDQDGECLNPACRATHEGHLPYRHSVQCKRYRGKEVEKGDEQFEMEEDKVSINMSRLSSSSPVIVGQPRPETSEFFSQQEAIHRHHSSGFHGTHHIAEHLTMALRGGPEGLESKLTDSRLGPNGKSPLICSEPPHAKPSLRKDLNITKYLQPVTQMLPVARINPYQYVEVPIPYGHPQRHGHFKLGKYKLLPDATEPDLCEPHKSTKNIKDMESSRSAEISTENGAREQVSAEKLVQTTSTTYNDRDVDRQHSTKFARDHDTDKSQNDPYCDESLPSSGYGESGRGKAHQKYKNIQQMTPKGTEGDNTANQRWNPTSYLQDTRFKATDKIALNDQSRRVPTFRASSPPPWLINPTMPQGNVQRLRHVDTRCHSDLSHHDREQVDCPEGSVYHREVQKSPTFLRTFAESRPISNPSSQKTSQEGSEQESITQLGLRHELQTLNKRARETLSPSLASRRAKQVATEDWKHETPDSQHMRGDSSNGCGSFQASRATSPNIPYNRGSALATERYSSSTVISTDQFITESRHKSETMQEQYLGESARTEVEPEHLRGEQTTTTHNSPNLPTIPSMENELEKSSTENGTSNNIISRGESLSISNQVSDYELYRPKPVAPPNHECSWKDQYMALSGEIRLLKAEMSTRMSLDDIEATEPLQRRGSHQEDDLGIQGLTIVMHFQGKDDLVINTDLTQDINE